MMEESQMVGLKQNLLSTHQHYSDVNLHKTDCDTYASAILRTLQSFKQPEHNCLLSIKCNDDISDSLDGLSDNPTARNINENNSLSSSSLLSPTSTDSSCESSVGHPVGDYYKIKAKFHLKPHITDESTNLQLQKFKRLLKRLELVYSNTNDDKPVIAANTLPKMSAVTILPPPTMLSDTTKQPVSDRYLFRSSNRKKKGYSYSSTPPTLRKRYKFSKTTNNEQHDTDSQSDHEHTNVYRFRKNGKTTGSSANSLDQRSVSSDRYDFSLDKENIAAAKTLTFVRSGRDLETRSITYIHGKQQQSDNEVKKSTMTTPYLFPPTIEQKNMRHPSHTSSFDERIAPEEVWESKRVQPSNVVFDSKIDSIAGVPSQKRVRIDDQHDSQMVYDQNYKPPMKLHTATTTNGVGDTSKYPNLKRTPVTRVQVVRFDSTAVTSPTSRSYLDEARERLATKRRGQSPQSFNKSLDRFVSTTNQKLKQRRLQQDRQQQRILTPPTQFQHPQSIDPENVTIEALKRRHNIDDYHQRSSILRNGRGGLQQQRPTSTYVSQYYANSDDDQQLQQIYPTPPIDYPIDSDDSASEEYSRPLLTTTSPTTYIRGQVPSAYLAHSKIMKNVNRSLLAKDFINTSTQTLTTSMTAADNNRLKLLDRAVRRQLKNTERQSLQRELNHDLIRCFSSTYIDDLRREEIRYQHTRTNMKSYANEDIEDIYMSSSLENYKMKTAIDREKRIRLGINSSLDPQSSSTPTSSIIGRLSPLSTYSPMMMSSFQDGTQNAGAGDVQSLGFETDRRSQRSVTSTSQTVSNRPPDVDLFYEIVHEHFRGVDATIAGQVSNASQYTSPKKRSVIPQHQQTLSQKPVDVDSDIEINSNSSFWSDEDEQQQQQQMDTDDVPQHHLPQRQINRYLSTVNRSLLDRPSDLISDYYISHLNRSMQDSVRHVETIARNLARNRWRDEFDQLPKLGRSLSAEHLYQVRREHLRYRQPFTTPVSFTAEDVSDIYKPFQLENYKRKIAIEIERRRRERQGQLSTGFRSPMYANEPDLNAVKSYQPVIQVPIIPTDSSNRLPSRTHTVYSTPVTRLQEFDNILDRDDISRNNILIVNPPVVHTKPSSSYSTEEQTIPTQRAKRLLTDDGTDMMHHVEILNSEPIRQSIIKQQHQGILTNRDPQIYHHVKIRPPPEIAQSTLIIDDNRVDNRAHSSIVQSTMHPTPIRERVHTDSARSSVQQPQYEKLTILPQQNTEIRIRQDRAQTKIEEQNNLINGVLKTSQELLIADQEPIMPDRIRRRVNIIPTQQPSPPSLIHQTKIFSHSPIVDKIQISQADVIESSNADDLAMVNIKNVVTINKEEINELNQIAQQAQRLQIEPKDLEHAMIIMDRHRPHQQTHYEQSIHERPFILNAPTVEHFKPHDEEVERYLHQRLIEREQKSHLIIPEAHHMARIEQDIHIFENIEKLHQQQNDRHHLNEIPTHDSGIVSLNTSSSQVSDRPLILNASSQQRLKIDDYLQREYAEQMYDDNYYNRQQFINYTKNDQNENLYRIASQEKLNENIYETVDKLKDNNQLQQSQRLKSQSTEQLQMIRPNEQTTVIYDTTEEFKQDKTAVEEKLKKVYDTLPSKMNLLRPEQTDVPLIYESADFHRKEPVYDIIIKNRQHPPVPPLTTGITQEFYEEIIAEQAPAKNIRETYEAETRSEAEMYERLTHFDRGDGEHEQKTLPKQQEHIELNRAQQGDRSLIYSQGNLHQLDVDELSLMSDTQDEREITQLERELRPKLVQLDQINRVQYYHKPIIGIQPDIRTDTTRNLNEEQLAVREETALLNDHHLDTSIGRQRIIQQQPSQYGHGKQQRMILDDTISLNQDDYQTLKHHASEAFVERNEIQYGDSYGRASLNQVKSFNAPSVLSTQASKSDTDEIELIKQCEPEHAIIVDDERFLKTRLIAQKTNRASVVHDSEWTNERVTSLMLPSAASNPEQQARHHYPPSEQFQKANVHEPTSIYSRAKAQLVEHANNEQSSDLPVVDNRQQSTETKEKENVINIAHHSKYQSLGLGMIEHERRSSMADEQNREEIEHEIANEVMIDELENVTHDKRKTQLGYGRILDNNNQFLSSVEDRDQDVRELAMVNELVVSDTLAYATDEKKQMVLGQGMLVVQDDSSIADEDGIEIEQVLADEQFVNDVLRRAIEQEDRQQLGYGLISHENAHRLSLAEQDEEENDRLNRVFAYEIEVDDELNRVAHLKKVKVMGHGQIRQDRDFSTFENRNAGEVPTQTRMTETINEPMLDFIDYSQLKSDLILLNRPKFEYETQQQEENEQLATSDNKTYAQQLISEKTQSENAVTSSATVFCRADPVSDPDDDDHLSLLSDDSVLLHHQHVPNTKLIQNELTHMPDKSTSVQTFNYPQHDQEYMKFTQVEEHVSSPPQHDRTNSEIQQNTPMHLPLISQLNEAQHANTIPRSVLEILHDNVYVENERNKIILPTSTVTTQPLYRTKSLEMLEQRGTDESQLLNQFETDQRRDRIDSVTLAKHDTMAESVKVKQPITILHREEDNVSEDSSSVNIEINIFSPKGQKLAQTNEIEHDNDMSLNKENVRIRDQRLNVLKRPYSATSSVLDVENFLNRFEDSLDQHEQTMIPTTVQELPLIDQISLSHTTSMRSYNGIQLSTEKAIEQYERENPTTSRKLPSEWYQQQAQQNFDESNEYDEQLVEQITFEKELDAMEEDTLRRQYSFPRINPPSPTKVKPLYTAITENLAEQQQFSSSSKVNLNNVCDNNNNNNNVFNNIDKRFETINDYHHHHERSISTSSTCSSNTNAECYDDHIDINCNNSNFINLNDLQLTTISHCSPTSDYETDSLDKQSSSDGNMNASTFITPTTTTATTTDNDKTQQEQQQTHTIPLTPSSSSITSPLSSLPPQNQQNIADLLNALATHVSTLHVPPSLQDLQDNSSHMTAITAADTVEQLNNVAKELLLTLGFGKSDKKALPSLFIPSNDKYADAAVPTLEQKLQVCVVSTVIQKKMDETTTNIDNQQSPPQVQQANIVIDNASDIEYKTPVIRETPHCEYLSTFVHQTDDNSTVEQQSPIISLEQSDTLILKTPVLKETPHQKYVESFIQEVVPFSTESTATNLKTFQKVNQSDDVEKITKQLLYSVQNQSEQFENALLLYSHRLLYGHDLFEDEQQPLEFLYEPAHFLLPIINEIQVYRTSFLCDYPRFNQDNMPYMVVPLTHDDEKQFAKINYIQTLLSGTLNELKESLDISEEEETINFTNRLDNLDYIEHYRVQPLYSFPETLYAQVTEPPSSISMANEPQLIDENNDRSKSFSNDQELIESLSETMVDEHKYNYATKSEHVEFNNEQSINMNDYQPVEENLNFFIEGDKEKDELSITEHIVCESSASIEHTVCESPAFIEHTVCESPAFIEHTVSETPASIEHTVSESPAFIEHTVSETPASIEHTVCESPAFIEHTVSETPGSIEHTVCEPPISIEHIVSVQNSNESIEENRNHVVSLLPSVTEQILHESPLSFTSTLMTMISSNQVYNVFTKFPDQHQQDNGLLSMERDSIEENSDDQSSDLIQTIDQDSNFDSEDRIESFKMTVEVLNHQQPSNKQHLNTSLLQEYILHAPREITILSTEGALNETQQLHVDDSSLKRKQQAKTAIEDNQIHNELYRLPEHLITEVQLYTPTGSVRERPPLVEPSTNVSWEEMVTMKKTTEVNDHDQRHLQQATFQYGDTLTTNGRNEQRHEQQHMPPERLHTEPVDHERARVKTVGQSGADDDGTGGHKALTTKNGEILVRDMVVQHISEDEKSTSSEEVIFEEWSEEYKIRRTDEFDQRTNRLISSKVETTDRKKGDVVKEEYREKNERIKGHKSYDILREVYRRVPATTFDTPPQLRITHDVPSHYYEEISAPQQSSTASFGRMSRYVPIERMTSSSSSLELYPPSEGGRWAKEDIKTTVITSGGDDRDNKQQQLSPYHAERVQTKLDKDISSSSYTYDRVRQQLPVPSTTTALASTTSSQYDRISNIMGPVQRLQQYRRESKQEQDDNQLKSISDIDVVSEEYHVELTHDQPSTASKDSRRTLQYVGLQDLSSKGDVGEMAKVSGGDLSRHGTGKGVSNQRMQQQRSKDDTSEEELDHPFGSVYTGLSKIVSEAGRNISSMTQDTTATKEDWRTKLKQVHTPSDTDAQEQVDEQHQPQQHRRLYDKDVNTYYTAQRVSVLPDDPFDNKTTMGRIKEVTVRVARDKTPPEHRKTSLSSTIEPPPQPQLSPSLARSFKEVTVAIARGSSPEKRKTSTPVDNSNDGPLKRGLEKLRNLYSSEMDEEEFGRSRDTTTRYLSKVDDDRQKSTSSFQRDRTVPSVDERRAKYESTTKTVSSDLKPTSPPSSGRVGELKNAFEIKDETQAGKYTTSIVATTTGLTEQRRKQIEEQLERERQDTAQQIRTDRSKSIEAIIRDEKEQYKRQSEFTPSRITRTSDRPDTERAVSEYTEQSALTRRSVGDNERRITEIHTAPAARITDRISRFETGDQQQSTQRGISLTKQTIDRESIDKRRQIYETDMEKRPTQGWTADRTLTDVQRPYDTADFRRRLEDTVSGTVIPPPLSPSPKDIPTISSKSTTRVQSTDRLGRSGFDAVKSALESSMTKPTTPHTSIDITIKEKRPSGYNAQTGMVSSIDSDLSVGGPSSPPIYQSTPKPKDDFNLYKKPDGNESEDELSEKEQEETTTVTEMTPSVRQRRRSRNRLRDFSSSTPGHATTFNETNMENLLSHVPISKGKGLLIELSPHVSDSQMPTKSHLKPTSSDSGIFDYSTATSIGRPSWMNTSSQFLDDNAANIRDSGIYVDQTSASSRSRRYHTSDTDLTSSEYDQKRQHQYQTQVDEPLSKSTYKYETEILQPKQLPRIADEQQRNVRRHLTGTFHTDTNTTPGTLSDYDNLANYRSGGTTTTTTARIPTKQVPITTQSRAKPLILNEIETIETETHVQFEMNRTREIKESTKTEPAPKGAPKTSKITTTNITTRTPDSSSDEALKTSRRVLLNEKPQYYTDQSKTDRIPHTQTSETYISSRPITTEIHQSYKESGAHRFSSSPSDTVTYETGRRPPSQSSQIAQKHSSPQQEEPVRIEETWFKPIQRDRSHDSLITATTSEHQRHHPQRSSIRTCSAGPRTMQVTSLSPDSQVTFGKYDSNEIIAIVRVPEMNQQQTPRPSTTVARESSTSPLTQIDRNGYSSTLRPSVRQTSMSEPELHIRAKQEAEQQQTSSKYLQQQQLVATSYIPTAEQQNRKTYERLQTLHQNDAKRDLKYLPSVYVDQETDSSIISGEPAVKGRRSRIDPYDNTDGYRHVTPPVPPTRSLSYHSAMHDQLQQQQQYPTSSSNLRPHSLHSQHRTASLGNLFGNNIEFEIEIEKRPPQQPERPTVIELNQATRAIVTTSKDGRVSIQNVTARPGNTVIINSDFHSSDRSLNRSSGYFSSDELRSQGVNTNYSSDEQSGASNNPPSSSSNLQQQGQQQTHIRRYNTKNTTASGGDSNGHSTNRLPAYYRSKHDNVEKINQILNQFRNGNGTTSSSTPVNTTPGFNDAIAQIDALYNNLDINNDKLDKTNARDYYSFNQLEPTTTNDNDDTLTSPTSQIQTPKYNFNKSGKERSTDSRRSDVLNRFDDNLAVRRSNNSNTFTNSPDGSGYKRYSSTGFQHIPNEHDAQTNGGDSIVQLVHASSAGIPHTHSTNSTIQHLISPSHHLASSSNDSPYHLHSQKQRRRHHQNNDDDRHSYSQSDLRSSSFIDESQNMNNNNNNNDNSDQSLWQPHSLRTSLTDLLVVNNPTTTPIQSQSLSSSGIVADYGSSPTNYYSSSSTPQPFTSQQNRTNQQGFRNRTSVKMVKQKNAAKKRGPLDNQGMYSEDEDSGDSPLSDSDRHQRSNLNEMTNTSAFNHSRQQQHQH